MPENVCIRCGGALVDTGIYCPACRAEEDRKTDDARLQRLTELARKLWHHDEEQPVAVERGLRGCDPATAFVRTANGIVLDIAAPNDRALDALEAALLVLDMSPERAARLLHGMRTYRECPCVGCERDRALASEKK